MDSTAEWVEKTDNKSGKTYYYNTKTKETTWKKPEGFTAPSASPSPATAASTTTALPDGWVEKADPKTGKSYYYHKATKTTTWTLPTAADEGAHTAAATETANDAPKVADSVVWVEKSDPKSGKTYYYNQTTKATSWTKPEGSAFPAPSTANASDWVEKTDPKSGKVYYYNTKTKATSWTKPELATAAEETVVATSSNSPSAVAEDWMEKVDPKTGKTYYFNTVTKATSWAKPETSKNATPLGVSLPVTPAPSDWVEKTDPKSGKVYYYNTKTKATQWHKPEDATPTPAAAAGSGSPSPAPEAVEWVEKVDPKTGKTYYVNPATKATSWTKPEPATNTTPAATPTPPGTAKPAVDEWVEALDSTTGQTYYYNAATKETSWTKPAPKRRTDALPEGWVEREDVVTGRTYYFHVPTKQPSWVKPTIDEAEASRKRRQMLLRTGGDDGDSRDYVTTLIEGKWEKRFEPRTGSFYYYNIDTHETRWDMADQGRPNLALDVTLAKTIYLIGGTPHSRQVLKWDGGIVGWLTQHEMELPHDLDMMVAFVDSDSTITVCGNRSMFNTDVATRIALPRAESDKSLREPGSAVMGTTTALPFGLRVGQASVPVTGGLIVGGGYTNVTTGKVSSECYLYDLPKRKTHQLPSFQVPRASHALAVVDLSSDKHLSWYAYSIGGFDGVTKTNVVERYVLGQPYWEIVSPIKTPRASHGAIVVDRTLYVFGGRSGYTVLNTGEYMHTQSTGWLETAPMSAARCNFGIASIQSFIFCVGGWNGSEWLSNVEAYDIRLDSWRAVHNLPSPLSGAALVMAPYTVRGKTGAEAYQDEQGKTKAVEKTLADRVRADVFRR